MMNTSLLLLSLLGLAACGDNFRRVAGDGPDAPAAPSRAVIVAGDFTAGHPGVLTTLDPETRNVKTNVGPALAVGNDPMLRHYGSELLVINRAENNITILDDQTLAFKEQLGTGPSSNPQDVALVGNRLYVPVFGGTGVAMLTRGSTTVATIDLSADDPDGKPNCNSIYQVGSDLYVSCGLLDDTMMFLPPRGPGKVYIIDSVTNAIKTSLTLTTRNPIALFEQVPTGAPHAGDLVLPTVFFNDGSGCIERITTGASPAAAGCLLTNTALGGYATRVGFEVSTADQVAMVWTAVATSFPHANLRGYDLMTSTLWEAPINPSTQAIADLVHCPSGEVIVVDSTMNANGLRVYVNATEQTTAAIPIGLGSFSQHGLVCY